MGVGAVFLVLFFTSSTKLKAQSRPHSDSSRAKKFLKHFDIAEVEASYAPLDKHFLANTNGLAHFSHNKVKVAWFGEYNINTQRADYSVSLERKLYKPFYVTTTYENDFFGEHPKREHLQVGVKAYFQHYEWFSKPFLNFNVGFNYSCLGTALDRLYHPELTFNFLTHPIWVNKSETVGIVFQAMGRVREKSDFFIFQTGIESKKLHSILVVGTGQVYNGETEIFFGLQYAFAHDEKGFILPWKKKTH